MLALTYVCVFFSFFVFLFHQLTKVIPRMLRRLIHSFRIVLTFRRNTFAVSVAVNDLHHLEKKTLKQKTNYKTYQKLFTDELIYSYAFCVQSLCCSDSLQFIEISDVIVHSIIVD